MQRYDLTLPTEAQWEYAARSGSSSIYWTGDSTASLQGALNISDAEGRELGSPESYGDGKNLRDGHIVHSPVGQFRANAFGLHNAAGNVGNGAWISLATILCPSPTTLELRLVSDPNAQQLFRGGAFEQRQLNAPLSGSLFDLCF